VTRTGSISRPLHQAQKIAHLASYTIPVYCLTDFEMCEVAPSEKPFWRSPSLRVAKREASSASQDQAIRLQDHTYCTSLAKTSMVSRTSASVLCQVSETSFQTRSSVTEERRRRTFRPKTETWRLLRRTEGLELEIQRFPVCEIEKVGEERGIICSHRDA
jgi:hypothetical protein